MSEKLGTVRYAGQQLQYLGEAIEDNSQISPETRKVIDEETRAHRHGAIRTRARALAEAQGRLAKVEPVPLDA